MSDHMGQEGGLNGFEKTYRQHSGISVLVAQVQVYCQLFVQRNRQRKNCITFQAHLLQPVVIVERRKKYVLCVWRVPYNTAKFGTRYTASYPATGKFYHIQEIKSNKVR